MLLMWRGVFDKICEVRFAFMYGGVYNDPMWTTTAHYFYILIKSIEYFQSPSQAGGQEGVYARCPYYALMVCHNAHST
jgi:hypothetical protein